MTAGALLRQADINKSITELWNKTYKGSDIDGIQIKTEDEGCTSDGRRKQSYRVVMRKGDTSLDMRGRCSAGQKACWRWHLHASPPVAPYIAPYTELLSGSWEVLLLVYYIFIYVWCGLTVAPEVRIESV